MGVAPPLAMEVPLTVAAAGGRRADAILRAEALDRGRRLAPSRDLGRRPGAPTDQRAVDRKVLATEELSHPRVVEDCRQEPGRDLALEQPVPVGRERGRMPHRIVDAEADERAEQQVEVQPLHQLALRADRVERLQQERPQQLSAERLRESFIGRLRDELLNEEIFENLAHARRVLKRWRLDYNQVRPLSAHAGMPPAHARLLAAGARPGLLRPAARPLAPSPITCYQPEGLPS
jgi:Integrase core domain